MGKVKQEVVARILNISVRQVQRKVHGFRHDENWGCAKSLSRPPHNAFAEAVKRDALEAYRTYYYDMGPTQAMEYLAERGDPRQQGDPAPVAHGGGPLGGEAEAGLPQARP